jgi:predicted RNase H-like HicB family nuclease
LGEETRTPEKQHMNRQLTAIIKKEDDGYVALCPEIDVASQGNSIAEARENLREALELFFEAASEQEIDTRLHKEVYITQLEVAVG